MQAPTAEVQAVLEVHSEVDEGISFTFFWQLTHFRGRRSVRENCEKFAPSESFLLYSIMFFVLSLQTAQLCWNASDSPRGREQSTFHKRLAPSTASLAPCS